MNHPSYLCEPTACGDRRYPVPTKNTNGVARPHRLQGYGSASQVPASYFERRKRVRVRIAKVVAAAHPNPVAPAEGYGGRTSEDEARASEQTEEGTLGGHAKYRPGADGRTTYVFLHRFVL